MSRLTIAIPSKGRLKEQTEAWLAGIGYPVRQIGGERGYTAEIDGLDAEVRLLSAREIAQGLIEGSLDFGVTGEDLLNDLAPDGPQDFRVLKRLGFGGADVVVAVPQAWFDVDSMADLEAAGAAFRKAHGRRLRVATKYLRLTRRWFAQKSVGEYRLVESAGATEAAPSTGTADVIVDITTTGATLKANGLKVLRDGVILQSEAAFTQSVRAAPGGAAQTAANTLVGALSRSDHKS
ncbi:MAG: ATP phosphoribosyltransferase [Hyphomonas sp.]|nr:ATP phosphoribosyltransferase [Hyphomonas sp.]